jgi:hypothetical protein
MFGYTAFPSIYGPSLTGIAGTARANDCLRPGCLSTPKLKPSSDGSDSGFALLRQVTSSRSMTSSGAMTSLRIRWRSLAMHPRRTTSRLFRMRHISIRGFRIASDGITSAPNVMKFRPAILEFITWEQHTSGNDLTKADDVITHKHRIVV